MAALTTSPLVKTYTLAEFWELPEPADHSKLELIAGVLYMTPPPVYLHENAVSRLNRLLSEYLIKSGDQGALYVPRAGIWRKPNSWLEPDLFYVSAETKAQLEPDYRTTADLVIEVISPGSAIYDRNTKADTYAALEVKELWLVDETLKLIEARVLKQGQFTASVALNGEHLTSVVLPGFTIKVSDVFSD